MKSLPIILSIFVLISCGQKEEGVTVSGLFENPLDDQLVKIELIVNEDMSVVDSFYMDNSGKFERTIKVDEPGFYRLNFNDQDIVNMILNDTDVQIVKNTIGENPKYMASGTVDNDHIQGLMSKSNDFGLRVQQLNEVFTQARTQGDMESVTQIQSDYMQMMAQHTKELKAEIWKMDNSIAGILSLSFIENIENEFSFMDSLATKYESQLPNSAYAKDLREQVESLRRLAIGSPAPEIDLPTPDGGNFKLSNLKGNYVLIDFWAAWCRPCRMENPNVVRIYDEYHSKGFDILSVSLDRKKEAWVEAIAADNLTWNHVSDLQYFNSIAAQTYQINAIPATYLIDPNGIIVAKNIRGQALEAKLREIFG